MEKVAPYSKFVGHSTEIIWQSKIRASLSVNLHYIADDFFQ